MNFHPLFVHFPIALFSFAFMLEIIELFKGDSFKNSSLLILAFAILGAVFAVQSGNIEAQTLSLNGKAKEILEQHQSSANFFLILLALIFMLKLYIALNQGKTTRTVISALFVLYFLGLLFIYRTAYFGTKLVFDYGVGTKLN